MESRILSFEKSCVEKFSRSSWFLILVLIAVALYSWLSYPVWAQTQPGWSRFFLAQDRYWSAVTLFFGFYLGFVLPFSWRKYFYQILFAAIWLVPCFVLKIYRPIIVAPIAFVALNTFWLLLPRVTWSRKIGAAGFVAASFVLLLWLIGLDAEISQDYRLFRFFWVLHLEMLLLYFLRESFRSQAILPSISLNPLQLFAPLPWPTTLSRADSKAEIRTLQVSGLIQLVFAQTLFFLLLIAVPKLPVEIPYLGNMLQYAAFIFFATAAFNIVSGSLRIFGFRAGDATYFLALSKSPLEIWQRGSAYMAQFLFQVVFFPIWKQTRKLWLAGTVLALLVLIQIYFFHELFLRELLRWLAPTLPIAETQWEQIFWIPIFWMSCWLVWIGLFHALTKVFRFLKTEHGAWVAIFLTHLGSSQILFLAKEVAALFGIHTGS
ncbi:MAG: hypothetical protein ACXWC9_05500 [Pseudobdellovibrionaceae bacterium]